MENNKLGPFNIQKVQFSSNVFRIWGIGIGTGVWTGVLDWGGFLPIGENAHTPYHTVGGGGPSPGSGSRFHEARHPDHHHLTQKPDLKGQVKRTRISILLQLSLFQFQT